MKLLFALIVALSMSWTEGRKIEFNNKCGYDIWVSPLTNAQGAPLPGGNARIQNNGWFTYQIPDAGWYVVCLDIAFDSMV